MWKRTEGHRAIGRQIIASHSLSHWTIFLLYLACVRPCRDAEVTCPPGAQSLGEAGIRSSEGNPMQPEVQVGFLEEMSIVLENILRP
jgi:hypothetical protein